MDSGGPSTLRQRKVVGATLGSIFGGFFQLVFHPHGFDIRTFMLWPAAGLLGYLLGRFSIGRFWPDFLRGLAVSVIFWTIWAIPYLIAGAIAEPPGFRAMATDLVSLPAVGAVVTAYLSPLIAFNALVLALLRNHDSPAGARHA